MGKGNTFSRDDSGATAVEFALVASILIMTILFVLSVGLAVYMTQALDYATSKAARQIMVGAVQNAGATQASFPATYVCPYLPAAMSCSNVIVNIQTITEAAQPGGYYSLVNSNQSALIIPPLNNAATQFSPGVDQSYEYLQVIYPITFLPAFVTSVMGNGATYNGSPAILLVSTTAFRNENY